MRYSLPGTRHVLGNRGERKKVLILSQGSKTEILYFRGFARTLVDTAFTVKPLDHTATNISMIQEVTEKKKDEEKAGSVFDDIWCVFDDDNASPQEINAIFTLAEQKNIHLAYSNLCFELWFILHFQNSFSPCQTPHEYEQHLGRLFKKHGLFGGRYDKANPSIFDALKDKTPIAISRAARIAQNAEPSTQPYTSVYEIVTRYT